MLLTSFNKFRRFIYFYYITCKRCIFYLYVLVGFVSSYTK